MSIGPTPLNELIDYVERATVTYRKGDVVKVSNSTALRVITIDAFPALPEGDTTTIDCHFVEVGFTEALAEHTHEEFAAMILAAADGEFARLTAKDWAGGPSYIAIGGWIGDQGRAFQFMAMCVAHGLADAVITPERLHITGAEAEHLAGLGLVMLAPMRLGAEAA